MDEPLQCGAFQERLRLVAVTHVHRKPETDAGEEANVVMEETGEKALRPIALTAWKKPGGKRKFTHENTGIREYCLETISQHYLDAEMVSVPRV
jgi:hypothetical protein